MRRSIGWMLVFLVAFALALSPAAYAQQSTPTGTPTATDGSGATDASTPAAGSDASTDGAAAGDAATGAADDAVAEITGAMDKMPEASGTVRQSFDLLGAVVENTAGERVGTLDNLLVIPSTGYIPFALIAAGGIFGLGEKLIPVPFSAMQYDAGRGVFILDTDRETLEDAPSLGRYASPNTRELLRNTELRSFWSQFDMSATGGLPGAGTTGTGASSDDTGSDATTTPDSAADATGTTTPEATDTTGAGSNATTTPEATTTIEATTEATTTITDTTDADAGLADTSAAGLVQVGSFGEQSLRGMGLAGQGDEDLVRLTEMGDFAIIAGAMSEQDADADVTGAATPEAATPEATSTTDATGAITGTDTMTDTTGLDDVTGSDAITGTDTMTDTTGADDMTDTEAITDTEAVTDTVGTGEEIDLDEAANQIGRVEDLLIDVEAARVLYVLASIDMATFANLGVTEAGADVDATTGTMTDTLPSATGTPMATGTPAATDAATDAVTDTLPSATGTPMTTDATTGTMTDTLPSATGTPMATGTPAATDAITGTDTMTATTTTDTATDTTGTATPVAGSDVDATDALTDTTAPGSMAGAQMLLIPWQGLELDLVDEQFTLLVPLTDVATAPFIADFTVPDFTQSGWDSDVRGFWTPALASLPAVTDTGETGLDTSPATGTGTDTGTTDTATPETGADTGAGATGTRRPGRNIATDSGVVMQATEIVGTNVNDPLGQNLGELTDLLFGSNDGRIYYGVLSYGGFLGLGTRHVAVPWSAFRFDAENETFVLDTNQETLDNAPVLTQGEEGFGTPGWDAETQDYWSGQGMETPDTSDTDTTGAGNDAASTDTGATGTMTDTEAITSTETITGTDALTDTTGIETTGSDTDATGSTGATTVAVGQLLRVDRFLGVNVSGAAGDNLGEVSDLLVNIDAGEMLYAVVSYGGFLGLGANAVPLPWSALQVQATDQAAPTVTINTDKAMLDNAPQLDLGSLPEDISAGWDNTVRSYWERLND